MGTSDDESSKMIDFFLKISVVLLLPAAKICISVFYIKLHFLFTFHILLIHRHLFPILLSMRSKTATSDIYLCTTGDSHPEPNLQRI
jgi:hypothetical protein